MRLHFPESDNNTSRNRRAAFCLSTAGRPEGWVKTQDGRKRPTTTMIAGVSIAEVLYSG